MRKKNLSVSSLLLMSAPILFLGACNKELSGTSSSAATTATTGSASSATIAVATDSAGTDSVYLMQSCNAGYYRDSIASSALPDSVLSYLTNNYSGYGFKIAFKITDSVGTIGGYVVVISFNGKPVGLLFDAAGNFQRVLEQREQGDIHGDGWHHGGRFGNRDGSHRDTIALSSLPSVISSYLTTNYPADTLIRAYKNRDSSILVISKDDGIFANLFTSSGVFVKRIALNPPGLSLIPPQILNIAQDSLPAGDLTYLENTFPNYVFESALSVTADNVLQGYTVIIDANNTKYAVWFDSAGNVLATVTVW